jgi:hypothetical protein
MATNVYHFAALPQENTLSIMGLDGGKAVF